MNTKILSGETVISRLVLALFFTAAGSLVIVVFLAVESIDRR